MSRARPSLQNAAYADGLALAAAGRHLEAIARFEDALTIAPANPGVLFALGNTARAMGRADVAERFYLQVLAGEPDQVEVLVNLANLLRAGGRAVDAMTLLAPAIERNPGIPELWLTLGSACREAGDAGRAKIFYREALNLRPDYAPALGNLADCLADGGAVEDALAVYDRVVRAAPHDPQARLNRAVLYLVNGDIKRGWRDYEYRLKIPNKALRYTHGLPIWNAKKIRKGLRLLVSVEQGIGDQIAFASLISELVERLAHKDGSVVLETEPRLVRLFARSFPDASVSPCELEACAGSKTARYDWLKAAGGADEAIPIASLPGLLRPRLADYPRNHAYLIPDRQERDRWQRWLADKGSKPLIGLCWRSGKAGGLREIEYAPLELWADFIRAAPGTFVTLQYDASPDEILQLEQMSGRSIHVPPQLDQKQEIDRTCALISCLDSVVSAPTAVSWMSAGLGVPTFKILYRYSWMAMGANYEPMAPACRCVMPKVAGDWADCFAQTLETLKR